MKDALLSILRHSLTGLAGLGGFLVSKGLADGGDAAALDAAGVSLADALAAILAIVLARLALRLAGRFLSTGDDVGCDSQKLPAWLLPAGMAGVLGFPLSGCASGGGAPAMPPVKACYIDKAGNSVCYSTAEGLTATVDRRSRK